jgi:NADPH2:quinone reductase
MRAWLLDQLTGLDRLKLEQTADPTPAAGEVVLDLRFAALNPADYYLAQGQYPAKAALPHVVGRDGIGVVSAVGPGVSGWKVGEKAVVVRSEVGVGRRGTLAEKVAVPVESLVRPPAGWTDEQAGSATLVYLTAWQAISQWVDLPERAVVLITGASGGVGVAATQLASALGHTVVVLSRSEEKRRKLIELGASIALDAADADWAKLLPHQTDGRKIDLAIDNVGGPEFDKLLDVLAPNGRVSCVGRLAGPVPQFNTGKLFFKRLQVRGVSVGAYTPAESAAEWTKLTAALGPDRRPVIDSVWPLEEVPQAFARLKQGPMGKVVVRIGD